MSTEIKFKNGSYIKVLESNEPKRPTNIDYQTNYLCKFDNIESRYLWYKLCVYYYAKTELYDRTLTDLRSPYDPTEAYIQGSERSLSGAYARKIKQFINEAAISLNIPKYISSTCVYHRRAQDWIDDYNRLAADGEMDFIETEYEKYEKIKNTPPEHRGYRTKILILDDICDDVDKEEELKETIKNAEQKVIDFCGCNKQQLKT